MEGVVSTIEIAALHAEASQHRNEVRSLLSGSGDDRLHHLAEELNRPMGATLSVAFIGQYNAGKSSLIKELVPTAQVTIGANVATDAVVETQWNGLRLLDTPGVRAGRTEHDEVTEHAIASSDLLVFVITAELFDATIANYFRTVVLDRGRGSECLLVVNKAAQDAGTEATKREQIDQVLAPLTTDDVPVVFTDARSSAWARDTDDPKERAELLELSGMSDLVHAVDAFARRSGLRATLTTPVYEAMDAIDQAIEILGGDEEAQATFDVLAQQHKTLQRHRHQLDETVRDLIVQARNEIVSVGEGTAADMTADDDSGGQQANLDGADLEAERLGKLLYMRIEEVVAEAASKVSLELHEQQRELELVAELGLRPTATTADPRLETARKGSPQDDLNFTSAQLKKSLSKISTFFAENSDAGQKGHQMVYKTGKRLGVKFKPWGAVKTARRLGKVAEGLGFVVSGWEIYSDYKNDQQEADQERALIELRRAVRTHFTTWADDLRQHAELSFTSYLEASYNASLAAIDDMRQRIMSQRAEGEQLTIDLLDRRARLAPLLHRIHGVELVMDGG
jgi:hypothetical protein